MTEAYADAPLRHTKHPRSIWGPHTIYQGCIGPTASASLGCADILMLSLEAQTMGTTPSPSQSALLPSCPETRRWPTFTPQARNRRMLSFCALSKASLTAHKTTMAVQAVTLQQKECMASMDRHSEKCEALCLSMCKVLTSIMLITCSALAYQEGAAKLSCHSRLGN